MVNELVVAPDSTLGVPQVEGHHGRSQVRVRRVRGRIDRLYSSSLGPQLPSPGSVQNGSVVSDRVPELDKVPDSLTPSIRTWLCFSQLKD